MARRVQAFLLRGRVVDLAVGLVVGAAFTPSSLVVETCSYGT